MDHFLKKFNDWYNKYWDHLKKHLNLPLALFCELCFTIGFPWAAEARRGSALELLSLLALVEAGLFEFVDGFAEALLSG